MKVGTAALLAGTALITGCAAVSNHHSKTVRYTCDDGQSITATYLRAGVHEVPFVVLDWNGQAYGLALAPSASGARYANRYGPTLAGRGLEWWEAKGEARLGAFTGRDSWDTRLLLSGCRPDHAA